MGRRCGEHRFILFHLFTLYFRLFNLLFLHFSVVLHAGRTRTDGMTTILSMDTPPPPLLSPLHDFRIEWFACPFLDMILGTPFSLRFPSDR